MLLLGLFDQSFAAQINSYGKYCISATLWISPRKDCAPPSYAAVRGLYRCTLIALSCRRACARSYADCKRSQWSALDHPAFSKRIAISGDNPARPLRTRESVCLAIPSALAASVTLKPKGSRQASLIEWPGCGGFFMGMVFLLVLVIVPQVNVKRVSAGKAEQGAPITGYS